MSKKCANQGNLEAIFFLLILMIVIYNFSAAHKIL
uniref:Uncharacterized protein n=1 Tax=Arundo donax TaxID=35708 RepID=A0A0A8YA15_ARUDO